MEPFKLPQLGKLQAIREKPVIIYNSTINSESIRILYECLRKMGPTQHLNLVLSTSGGIITVARRLALLLREFTQYLTIMVPYRAMSAGTLLCLSANELVLGPMAELGPIDTYIGSAGTPPPDAPGMISAEDVRAFRQMAEDWFGVNREKDRLQVLALIAQRVFPTSLSSFYRSDRLIRQAAHELLRYQLPDAEDSVHLQIVNQLVGGYYAHDHVITRADAQSLGLQVSLPSPQEEAILWDFSETMRHQFLDRSTQPDEEGTIGLIMSPHFCARQIVRCGDASSTQYAGEERKEEYKLQPRSVSHISWEIDEE